MVRRNRISLLTALLLAAGFLALAEEKGEAFRLAAHPRLFLDKETKARLKAFIGKHPDDPLWQAVKGGMLGWQLAGDREAGRKAVEGALKQAREWNANPPQPGTSFSHTSTAEAMAYALDWCYELLTPEEKAEIVECGNNAAWGCLKGYEGTRADGRGGDPLYNHMTTRQLGALLWGIAAHGEGQQLPDENLPGVLGGIAGHGEGRDADFFLGHCYTVLKDRMVAAYQPWTAGGAMWEGGDYGWADHRHTLQMMVAVKSALGEDLTRVINLADRIPFFIHATRPTGDCFYFQGHAWSINDLPGMLYPIYRPNYRRDMIQFANAYPDIGIYVPTYLKRTVLNQPGGGLDEMLLKLNFPESRDYEIDWPPSWHAPSLGVVLARSRWGDPDATHLSFICGPYIHYYSDQDQGHFEIFKRERLVTDIRERDGWADGTLPSHMHNTIVVGETSGGDEKAPAFWHDVGSPFGGGQRGVNRTVGVGGRITALEDDYVNYLYVCGDLTGAYLADRIQYYTRQIVFVRPDYVIVFDRVETTTPDWRKRFFLYLWNKPTEKGEYQVMKYGSTTLLTKTLLPQDPVTKVIGPGYDGKKASAWGGRRGVSYHLEIEPKDKAKESLFLHFFKAADTETKETPQCQLMEEDGIVGLRFAEGNDNCTVLFPSRGPAGGHISIRRGSQTVVDRDLTQKVVTPPLLLTPEERKRQQEMIAKLRASRLQAVPEEHTMISEQAGEEFDFSGATWVNLGNAKITKTPDETLHILTQDKKPIGVRGIRTKNPLDFPVQVEITGKLRKNNGCLSFGLCDKDGSQARQIFGAGEKSVPELAVHWVTDGTYVNAPIRFGVFYRVKCTLNPEGMIPFEGVMMTEDGVPMGRDKEPDGVSCFHPETKYLFIGEMNQIGRVEINKTKTEGELLRWGRLLGGELKLNESAIGNLSYLDRDQGWMYARSDRTADVTWIALHCGGEGRLSDQGAFIMFKKGWLAVPATISGWGSSENTLSLQVRNKSYYIGGGSENRGPVRGIRHFEDRENYVYAMADLFIPEPRKPAGKTPDACDFLVACERHLVFVRPDHVVLFDRVRPKDAKYYPIWTVHFMQEPKFSEKVATAGIKGAGISLTTLLPEKVMRTTAKGRTWLLTEFGSEDAEEGTLEGLEELLSPDKFFLHLFRMSAGEPKAPSAELLKRQDTFGVKFALDTGYCEVVFKEDSSGGHIKIVGENEKAIVDRDLTTQVVATKK